MHPILRIFLLLVFLGTIFLIATVLLLVSGERVGAHRSSTFGQAWAEFEQGWGGEMSIPPPSFQLQDTFHVWVEDTHRHTWREEVRYGTHKPVLRKVNLNTEINYGVQHRNWLAFNTFEAQSEDTYVIENNGQRPGVLQISIPKFGNSALLSHFTLRVNNRPADMSRLSLDTYNQLNDTLKPGERRTIAITWNTKGMDQFSYGLSAWSSNVIDSLTAKISINTTALGISSFGLPHERKEEDGKSVITFAMDHFSSGHDIGLSFYSRSAFLDHVGRILMYSPAAVAMLILIIMVFTQVEGKSYYWIHHFFFISIAVFYFLFLSYTIRFFHVGVCIGISTLAMLLMAFIYFPAVVGRKFFLQRIFPFLLLLTLGFSLVFLIPVIQGIAFLVLLFGVFLAVMVKLSRSDFKQWPLLQQAPPPGIAG